LNISFGEHIVVDLIGDQQIGFKTINWPLYD